MATISYNSDLAQSNFYHDYFSRGLPSFYESPLLGYFGKLSKNQISKTAYNQGFFMTYAYEKDANGNITKVTGTATGQFGEGYTATNKYICK